MYKIVISGYHSTGNRSKFRYVEGSTASLYGCFQILSPLYDADKRFGCLPKYYQDNVINNDPITRQTFNYARPVPCDNNPQIFIALVLLIDEHYVLTLKALLRATPTLREAKHVQSSKNPNIFTAQETGI